MKNKLIESTVSVEYFPQPIGDVIEKDRYSKIPMSGVVALGSAFASFPSIFNAIEKSVNAPETGGLYRCVFPAGVSGKLAHAKDGSGALGAILKDDGGLAQARWIQAESVSTSAVVPFNPTQVFMAASLMNIEQGIGEIKELQQELIDIFDRDKKSQLLVDLETLNEVSAEYKYCWDKEPLLVVSLNQVKNIRRNAGKDILAYKAEIESKLRKISIDQNTVRNRWKRVLECFTRYKLALHVYSMASFEMVMLSKNFDSQYLHGMVETLREKAYEYKVLYTTCYDQVESSIKNSLSGKIGNEFAEISKFAGDTIGKIPIVKKTRLDKSLIENGNRMLDRDKERIECTMNLFRRHKDSGTHAFIRNIETVDYFANESLELLWDKENLYLPIK